jgi:hypothetical protein
MVASCSGLLVHEPLDQIAQLGFSAEHHDFVFGSVARGHLRELEPRGIASHCVDRTLPSFEHAPRRFVVDVRLYHLPQGEISLILPRVYAANQVLGPVRSARERSLMEGVGIENAVQVAGSGLVSKQVRETWETASAVPSSSRPGHLLNLLFVQMHR